MDETFDLYKNATKVMPRWSVDVAGVPPADAAFHEGAIRYLKEKGIWTDEHQQWNDARVKRQQALQAAWDETMAQGKDMSEEQFAELWEKNRQAAIASLN